MKSNYKVTNILPQVWAFEDSSSEHAVCYLILGEDKALLFDTGLGLAPLLPLVQKLTKLLIVVCISHWHFDHSGGAYEFEQVYGWKSVAMKLASADGISTQTINSQVDDDFWESVQAKHMQTKSFPNIELVSREQDIELGGLSFQVLHTPGHTQDSVCLYEPEQQWLLTGDTIYHGPIYLQFPDSSPIDYKMSIDRLASLPVKLILPGHNAVHESPMLLQAIQAKLKKPDVAQPEFPRLSIIQGETK